MNKNLSNLGVKDEDYEIVGIIGVDEDLLAFVLRLVCAEVMCYLSFWETQIKCKGTFHTWPNTIKQREAMRAVLRLIGILRIMDM